MSTSIKIVPDASVILKWVLPKEHEPYSKQAHAIGQVFFDNEIELLVPSLWVYEVGNVLTIKYPEVAADLLDHLTNLNIPVVQTGCRGRQTKTLCFSGKPF